MKINAPETGYLVGYARVSTEDQSLNLQLDALRKAGVPEDSIHVEHVSGASLKRPSLEFAIKDLRSGDTLIVWRLDRLARSMRQLYAILDRVYERGASFRSISESFDFGTASGKLVLGVLGLVAEFERQIISQRTAAGIAAVRARRGEGSTWGPKVYMTPDKINRAGQLLRSGLSGPKVAKKMGISAATVYAHWKQVGHHKWARRLPSRKPQKD